MSSNTVSNAEKIGVWRDIVSRQSTGPGFQNEGDSNDEYTGPSIKSNADPEKCKRLLSKAVKHLTLGEIKALIDEDNDLRDVFEP